MEATTAGQNAAQAVQDSFYGGLIGDRGGHIEQRSIPIFSAPHNGRVLTALR